jgi:two-component system OmpR family sensor kinase
MAGGKGAIERVPLPSQSGPGPSIRRKLTVWLSLAIVLVTIVAGLFSFVAAYQDANEIQDDILRQTAALLDRRSHPLALDTERGDEDEDARIVVAIPGKGRLFPAALPDGLQTVTASNGERFRVLIRRLADGRRLAVAQDTGFREDIATNGAFRTIVPLLILIPILMALVAILVRRMVAPIAAMARDIDRRGDRDLSPFAIGAVPAEIRPYVLAIDRLLGRVRHSVEGERRFIADAAHELRSPLTALSLQAERLSRTEMPAPAAEHLAALRRGIGRLIALVEQLLTLARMQAADAAPAAPAPVLAVFRRVLEDTLPLAEAKGIDLGIDTAEDIRLAIGETELTILVRNLVDNAIRYTPPGGRVDLGAARSGSLGTIRIADTGPGIPPEARERVLEPFHRLPGSGETGSGLGLSIVRAILDRLGGGIALAAADPRTGTGLAVTITLPLA